jgi:Transglutaminase-like enzymes, putative cysteine proteases
MKKIFVCLVLALFVLSSLQLQMFPEAQAKNDLNAKLISSETIVRLEEDGTITKDVSEVIEILSKQGVNLYQALKIDYYSETEKVNLKEVYTIANGKKYEVGEDAIKDITNPTIALVASSLYVDLKQKQISMPRVDVGSKIVYSYEITSKPLTSGVFFDQFIFNSAPQGIELNNISYTLEAPRNTYVNMEWNNLDDPRVEEKEDIMTYTWEIESIENAKPELLMPNSWDAYSWIVFSSFRNWDEVGSWYSDLAAEYDIYQTDTEIENEVDNLISEDMSGFDKVMAIYRFVAEKVRYVGISRGLGRFKPHNATSVYNALYGDCKDQATLLIAMLNHAGIKSYPALLGTASFARFLDRIPSLIWTQHVIVAVPTREGYLYFDPSSYMPPYTDVAPYYKDIGAIPSQDQNCDILISKPEETLISRTPILKAEDNLVRITQDIELKSDGTLEGNATFYCTGQRSEQMRMTFRLIEQLKEQEDSFLDPKTILEPTIQILAPGAEIVDFQVLSDLDKPDKNSNSTLAIKQKTMGRL